MKGNFTHYTGHHQFHQARTEETSSARDIVFIFWKNPTSYKFMNERKAITILNTKFADPSYFPQTTI